MAVHKAIQYCIDHDHLRDFLILNQAEVAAMSLLEGSWEEYADSMDQELERKKHEQPVESPVGKSDTQKDTDEPTGKQGRPEMDDSERSSDPAKSMSGKQPKPSNPEGSL